MGENGKPDIQAKWSKSCANLTGDLTAAADASYTDHFEANILVIKMTACKILNCHIEKEDIAENKLLNVYAHLL